MNGARPRILFLFNHDAAHQAAHIAGIAAALTQTGDAHVIAACGTPAMADAARALMPADAIAAIDWQYLTLPPLIDALAAPLNAVAPVRRLARLDRHLALFASVDIIVSPERTCLRIKHKLGSRAPAIVFVPHGAGDRGVTYHPAMAAFDLMLVSGQKVVDEMAANRIVPADGCRIIGYPKFDTVATGRTRLFDNDNPVFVYNPHFDPHLSSWYDKGIALMDWFAGQGDRFNLIVAPHVMLFRKKLHYSLEYRTARLRPDIPDRFRALPNILIDTAGPRLFDMSYTMAADAYIGDVSSQVYEFLSHRGACFFLDQEAALPPGAPPRYPFWQAGQLCRTVADLTTRIPDWQAIAARDRVAQDRLFAYTFDSQPDRPATVRGAQALLAYAKQRAGRA